MSYCDYTKDTTQYVQKLVECAKQDSRATIENTENDNGNFMTVSIFDKETNSLSTHVFRDDDGNGQYDTYQYSYLDENRRTFLNDNNFDGTFDTNGTTYFDNKGNPTMTEVDIDMDFVPDNIEYYNN